ncbi:GNAT family N-acetyltransferase [Brevibacterium limosum]|uniref:GNAT family N-acetyltransferase n=1 Tax=Brevibacterium limosum TaxID=2697565 RepID=UPI00389949B8
MAEAEGRVFGVAQLGRNGSDHVLYKLYLDPDYRGRGPGPALIESILQSCRPTRLACASSTSKTMSVPERYMSPKALSSSGSNEVMRTLHSTSYGVQGTPDRVLTKRRHALGSNPGGGAWCCWCTRQMKDPDQKPRCQ